MRKHRFLKFIWDLVKNWWTSCWKCLLKTGPLLEWRCAVWWLVRRSITAIWYQGDWRKRERKNWWSIIWTGATTLRRMCFKKWHRRSTQGRTTLWTWPIVLRSAWVLTSTQFLSNFCFNIWGFTCFRFRGSMKRHRKYAWNFTTRLWEQRQSSIL